MSVSGKCATAHVRVSIAFPVIVFKSLSTCLLNEFNRFQVLFTMFLHAYYNVCFYFIATGSNCMFLYLSNTNKKFYI